MATDHTEDHGDRATETRQPAAQYAGPGFRGIAAAFQIQQDDGAQEFPQLQLRLLPPLPKAGMHAVLHVLPIDQIEVEAQDFGHDVGVNGVDNWMGSQAASAGCTIRCETC